MKKVENCLKKGCQGCHISKSCPGNFDLHTSNSSIYHPCSWGNVKIHWNESDPRNEQCLTWNCFCKWGTEMVSRQCGLPDGSSDHPRSWILCHIYCIWMTSLLYAFYSVPSDYSLTWIPCHSQDMGKYSHNCALWSD